MNAPLSSDLVTRLRTEAPACAGLVEGDLLRAAADALESVDAEIGRVLADRDIAKQRLGSAVHLLRIARAAMTCKTFNAPNAKHGFVEIRKDIDDFLEAETP